MHNNWNNPRSTIKYLETVHPTNMLIGFSRGSSMMVDHYAVHHSNGKITHYNTQGKKVTENSLRVKKKSRFRRK